MFMIRDQNQVRMPALASVISAMMVWAADADGPTGDGLTDGRTDGQTMIEIRKLGLGSLNEVSASDRIEARQVVFAIRR